MPIKSFELTSIDAKRFSKIGERPPQLRVDHNTNITNVTAISDSEAQFEFSFMVTYSGVGTIKADGRLVWEGQGRVVAGQWAQKKSLPNEVFGPILASISMNCIPAFFIIARDLSLPPPTPLPQIQLKPETKSVGAKDYKSSMEVA
jgi:hypothetical protein